MIFYNQINKYTYLLNDKETKILNYLIENQNSINTFKLNKVAQDLDVAPNTIVRLVKKLKFSGFNQFKEVLYVSNQVSTNQVIDESEDLIDKTKALLNQEVINEITKQINKANKVIILGVGLSRHCAQELCERLLVLGCNAQTYLDPHLMNHYSRLLDKNDLLIAFSISGETKSIIEALKIAQLRQAQTISITSASSNTLASISQQQLYSFVNITKINNVDTCDRLGFYYLSNVIYHNYLKYIN